MDQKRFWLRLCFCVIPTTICSLASCTSVTVEGGNPSATERFGVIKIESAPQAAITIVRVKGVGFVPTSDGLVLGKAEQLTAYVSKEADCRAIFFVSNAAQVNSIIDLLKANKIDSKNFCEIRERKP